MKEIMSLVGFKSKNAVYKLINKMVADEVISVHRTRGGDAFDARVAEIGAQPIMVGMPTLKTLKSLNLITHTDSPSHREGK